MKKLFSLVILLQLCACSGDKKDGVSEEENLKFDAFKEKFVEALWKFHPNWASSVGYHKYDSILSIPDPARRKNELAFDKAYLDSLHKFKITTLSDNNKTDYHLLEDYFKADEWQLNTLRSYEWIPSHYNVCEGFAEILNNNYDSLDKRLRHFYIRMKMVPEYYEAAKKNIRNPTIEHTELAISQNLGGSSVFEDDLNAALKKSHLGKKQQEAMRERARNCVKAIKNYAAWLKNYKNKKPRSFRLGKDLYMPKFAYDIQSGFTAEEILTRAIARKKELHGKMHALTKQLWPKYFEELPMPENKLEAIKDLINVISTRHVRPDSFQTAIEKQIPLLVDFVKKKNLIWLDPSKPLVVRKEPAYMAGLAGASISSPGPYDKNGNTYYNVGSLAGWSEERAESYLREYNHWILQILNIHEAIPGHYVQLIYSNKSLGIIKSIFGNGAMVEGWAVYSELMMLENGYGAKPGSQVPEPEMWLMYYKWNLRSVCNTILDQSVHMKNMSRKDALNLLVNEAFQQRAEAEGKWRRVTLSQVQLCSYFTGFTEIVALREELKQKMGPKFNLKDFHETFLSFGSAPVKYIRELMLAQIAKEEE